MKIISGIKVYTFIEYLYEWNYIKFKKNNRTIQLCIIYLFGEFFRIKTFYLRAGLKTGCTFES